MRRYAQPRLLAVAAFLLASACSADSPTAGNPGGLHVSLEGVPDTLAAGDIAVFQVRVRDAQGNDLPDRGATLSSSDPTVALIDGAGRVRAVTAGTTTIKAIVEGQVGSARLVVSRGPAQLDLRRFAGDTLPVLIVADSVSDNGVVHQREAYLESGRLTLTGGGQPGYQVVFHYQSYAVTTDSAGQRHLTPLATVESKDGGSIDFDARGDLMMQSDRDPTLSHSASAQADGLAMLYGLINGAGPIPLLFRRARQ